MLLFRNTENCFVALILLYNICFCKYVQIRKWFRDIQLLIYYVQYLINKTISNYYYLSTLCFISFIVFKNVFLQQWMVP